MSFMTIRGWIACLLMCICTVASFAANAEIAVIVHPDNKEELSTRDIERIYLGRLRTFPNGNSAVALDQPEGTLVRAVFIKHVLNMTPTRLKTHWSQLNFSGRGTPPDVVENDEEVKEQVSKDPAKIGYIDAALVDDTVRVVYSY